VEQVALVLGAAAQAVAGREAVDLVERDLEEQVAEAPEVEEVAPAPAQVTEVEEAPPAAKVENPK
jgi:hypothetical protein